MIYNGTESNTQPQRILIEDLPGDTKSVRLADNVEEVERKEGEIVYIYDESLFLTKEPITEEEIEEDFDTFWEKGIIPDEDEDPEPVEPMTREELTAKVLEQDEALALIEDAILEMSEKVYK